MTGYLLYLNKKRMIFFIGIILTLFNYDHQTKQIYQKDDLKGGFMF